MGAMCRFCRVLGAIAILSVSIASNLDAAEPAIVIEKGSLARQQVVALGRDLVVEAVECGSRWVAPGPP